MAEKELTEKIKEIFSEQVESKFQNSDLCHTAEMFIRWNYERDFKTESFEDYCDYIEFYDIDLNDALWKLSGHASILDFVEYWVYDTEVKDFLDFCKNECEYDDEIEGFYNFINEEMKHLIYLYNKHLNGGE